MQQLPAQLSSEVVVVMHEYGTPGRVCTYGPLRRVELDSRLASVWIMQRLQVRTWRRRQRRRRPCQGQPAPFRTAALG